MKSSYREQESNFLRVLSNAQCRRMIAAAMEVLERTGVTYLDEEAVDRMKKAGCYVDGQRVRIPFRLVEKALNSVPRKVTLCNSRTGKRVMEMEGGNAYFGTGSDTPNFIDPYTQERIKASRKTVGMAAKVIDATHVLVCLDTIGDEFRRGIGTAVCVMKGGFVDLVVSRDLQFHGALPRYGYPQQGKKNEYEEGQHQGGSFLVF